MFGRFRDAQAITSPLAARHARYAKEFWGGYGKAIGKKTSQYSDYVLGSMIARDNFEDKRAFSVSAYATVRNVQGIRYTAAYNIGKKLNHAPSVRYRINVRPK